MPQATVLDTVACPAECPADGRRRVAVVEDDRNMALLLAYNLRAAGHAVTILSSGARAVDQLTADLPDLIVLDWELPDLAGIELLRQLRLHQVPRRVPVIMLTGRSDQVDRERALRTGADVFLSKPFAMSQLMSHVDALLAVA